MTNPRYLPRDFLRYPHDFGRRLQTEWLSPSPDATARARGQLAAAQLQHRISYGVLEKWMPFSATKKITTLARALDMPYSKLQRMLSGRIVMQLEDLARLHAHIGQPFERWLLTGENRKAIELADEVQRTGTRPIGLTRR